MVKLQRSSSDTLIWNQDEGFGICSQPPTPVIYDQDYLDEYIRRGENGISAPLNQCRVDMVAHHCDGNVLDFGGCTGHFAMARNRHLSSMRTYVYDINPYAARRIMDLGFFAMPGDLDFEGMTFWDSMEHLEHPEIFLGFAREWVFVSMPIFRDREHALSSKHFKPGEHYMYFTALGIEKWFSRFGFELEESNEDEDRMGREDIGSFAFRRST